MVAQLLLTQRKCVTIDVGLNLGLITVRLLQTGATVTAFEPQIDLCCASNATARYNKLSGNLRQHCGGVGPNGVRENSVVPSSALSSSPKWRYGAGNAVVERFHSLGLPTKVPLFDLADIVTRGIEYELIRLDTDSVDCDLLGSLMTMQRRGQVRFRSVSWKHGLILVIPTIFLAVFSLIFRKKVTRFSVLQHLMDSKSWHRRSRTTTPTLLLGHTG